jgi:hypothetical protein
MVANKISFLNQLADDYGFCSVDEMLEASLFDSVAPGICTRCGYSIEVEPDCQDGWCEECECGSVKSCLILAGII